MSAISAERLSPPRLLVKTTAVIFLTVAIILIVVLVIVTVNVRNHVWQSVSSNLESGQRIFAALEARQQRELRAQVTTLAENPTLKAAIDTYLSEAHAAHAASQAHLLATIDRELRKLAAWIDADAIILVDLQKRTISSAGRLAGRWPQGRPVTFGPAGGSEAFDGVVHAGPDAFRVVAVPLVLENNTTVGSMYLATILDQRYVEELARLTGARTAIVSDGLMAASTLPAPAARPFESAVARTRPTDGTMNLAGEWYAYRRVVLVGDTGFYALESIDEASRAMTRSAMNSLAYLAIGAIVLTLAASFWLARMLSEPIGHLSQSLAAMAASHEVEARLPRTGSSRELDALTDTFNALMTSVSVAEAQTRAAYTGAIRALATALDARDPYTAGHSERVSVLSVAIGRTLALSAEEVEVLRLGALLHDIGKIGVPDDVLRKPGTLTASEYDIIRQHPVLGARILRSVPFLLRHIPIVELHHERPDGRGYPHGMRGDDIPPAARIVHVADAYDAITSARAYRRARASGDALKELWRCAGTEFHAEIVGALAMALPGLTFEPDEIAQTVGE